jgi:hypothetical protein
MMSTDADPGPWPRLQADRLAAAVATLAEPLQDAALRAQLSALATVVSSLDGPGERVDPARVELQRRLEDAIASADEPTVIEAARALARHDRGAVRSVDWSAVSGG